MAEVTATTPEATILVAEDENNVLEMVVVILCDAGYRVLQASDGFTALSLALEEKPDLIVSDVNMPGLDGFGLCERLRANRDLARVPFIFLTGLDRRADVRHGMGLGADDYLTKPFEPDELLAAVRVRLARATEAKEAIERAGADLRDSIVRSLTHEFRTPLALVAGYTELLETDGQSLSEEELGQVLEGLHSGSARLMSLVEDFLLLTQVETGAIAREVTRLEVRPIFPDPVVEQAVAEAQVAAAARGVHLGADCQTAHVVLAIFRTHLAEIIARLVDNAIKFSKAAGGQVEVTTCCQGHDWVLTVTDEGIGIPPEALSWIFDAFRQVDRARLEQQGVGVGLTIVRGLVEVYGGRMAVESSPGQGSTFRVMLPVTGRRER
jgi:two-component system sensor histidine kinase/response regulator